MTSAVARMRTVQRLYRRRGDARTAGDIAYALYAGALATAIAGSTVLSALVQGLAQPVVLNVLGAPGAGHMIGLLCGAGLAYLAILGAVRGPALRQPFLLALLTGSDLPRGRTLRPPFAAATLVLALCTTGAAALFGSVFVVTGTATLARVAWFILAAASFGVLAGVVWLTGQRLGSTRAAGVLSVAILVATLLTWAVPQAAVLAPWGWVGLSWPAEASLSWPAPGLLTATALASLAFVPRLLNGLSGHVLLEQADRWKAAESAAGTADFTGALATYRAQPELGRSWRAVTATRPSIRFFLRDLVGTLRTPGRFVAGTAFLLLGGFLAAVALAPAGISSVIPAALGTSISYAAFGVFADGFRHAAEAAATPPLYQYSTGQLYALHALLPTLWGVACTIIGASAAIPTGAAPGALLSVGGLAVFLVAVRAYDSSKGTLPTALLAPVSVPGAELTGLPILAWQADAVLIATITATLTLALAGGPALTTTMVFAVAALAMVALTRRRLRHL